MSLKIDSCPFSLGSLQEPGLGDTLQEAEYIPGRAGLHPYFFAGIRFSLPSTAVMFSLFASPKRTPKKVLCIAALI